MDEKRAQTIEALQTFIQTQKTLLARTNSDIEQLKNLKAELQDDPPSSLSELSAKLDGPAFMLSEREDCMLTLPKNIHWEVFRNCDPAPLQALTLNEQQLYAQRNEPSLKQRSELSELQKIVKHARRTFFEPMLASIGYISEPEPESEQELDPEEVKRELERQKIRELKKRKIQASGLKLPSSSGVRAASGVFIRHDVEDESIEVDISRDVSPNGDASLKPMTMDVDKPLTPREDLPPPQMPKASSKASRATRPTKKGKARVDSGAAPPKKKAKKADIEDEPNDEFAPDKESLPNSSRGANKPKPETYKQAWSDAEQHLLEQLLEQIPDGEKFRWQKISRAMNGTRTPRQVASRVQKYFEKLKRFGIGVDGNGTGPP